MAGPSAAQIGIGRALDEHRVGAHQDGVAPRVGTHGDVLIEEDARELAAGPRMIGDGAYIAAGSAVVSDVSPGQLAVTRAQQRNIDLDPAAPRVDVNGDAGQLHAIRLLRRRIAEEREAAGRLVA